MTTKLSVEGFEIELEAQPSVTGLVELTIKAGSTTIRGKAYSDAVFEVSRILRDAAIASGSLAKCQCGHVRAEHPNSLKCDACGCSFYQPATVLKAVPT